MRCSSACRLSSDYLAGELEERQRSAIRGHLRTCEACAAAYADEALIVEAAADQPVFDPPASVWEGIAARLADAEIADSNRSRVWFWWRGAAARHRGHIVGASLACATVLALVFWPRPGEPPAGRSAVATAPVPATEPEAPALEFEQARGQELVRADLRYTSSIDELMEIVGGERAAWSQDRNRQFDDRMQAFELEINRQRQAGLAGGDVLARSDLYDVYRDKIDYLSEVALGEGLP